MTGFEELDYFSDPSLVVDPFDYYDWLRAQNPVYREPHHGVFAVTGYEEALAILRDGESFSACNAIGGPFPGLPVPAEGDDIGELIAAHRHVYPLSDNFATFDPPEHTRHRALLMRLITPRRLRENEAFMERLAARRLDAFGRSGRGEFIQSVAHPFAQLVIADFLGVPEADHEWFQAGFQAPKPLGALDDESYEGAHLKFLEESFTKYIEDRRHSPREDALTKLALARFPDGDLPEVADVVSIASMLFAAGQGTSVHLFGMSLVFLAENPGLEEQLRRDRERIPNYLEEVLRLESPNRTNFRLARKTVTVGGVVIPAGSTVMLMNPAANRDPRRFPNPHQLQPDRPNALEHLAFGRGVHSCPGGPLARAEGRVLLNAVLDRMSGIRLSEADHGPPGARRFRFQPSYFTRRLEELHIEYDPIEA